MTDISTSIPNETSVQPHPVETRPVRTRPPVIRSGKAGTPVSGWARSAEWIQDTRLNG